MVLVTATIAIVVAGCHYILDREAQALHEAALLVPQVRLEKGFPKAQRSAPAGHLHTLRPLHLRPTRVDAFPVPAVQMTAEHLLPI